MGTRRFLLASLVFSFFAAGGGPRANARDWHVPEVPPPPGAKRALLIGDSNIYGPFGDALQAALTHDGWALWRRGKPSTGLSRQDHYDWLREARAMIALWKPDLIIAQMGGNDVLAMTWADRKAHAIPFSKEREWRPAYEERARQFFQLLAAEGRRVFFLSPTNRGVGAKRVARVRDAQRAAAAHIDRLTFVDMFPFTSDANGRWLYATEDGNGHRVVIRRGDTIHLNDEGGAIIGARVLAALRASGL